MVAVSRPTAVIKLPSQQETIILAMDVSGSMRATDIKPSRIVASQEAAKNFVNELPRTVRVGVVSFAGTAAVVQAPTLSREDVVAAIDRFQLQRATAIGSGIVLSLATLFPDAGYDLSQITGAKPMPPGFSDKKKAQARVQAGGAGLLRVGGDHPADRWPAHHRPRHAGDGQARRRPRRAHLHRGHGHQGRRDHRLRGLEHARAPRRGDAQAGGAADTRRILLRRHRRRPEEGLRGPVEQAGGRKAARPRSPRCSPRSARAAARCLSPLQATSLRWFGQG